ncbi:hypothetical protein GCM10027614_55600 [Micromonospora vulcania]
MPAPRTPAGSARDRILDTAFRLFYAHGPRGVGVDTVIAESGVAKATLYKHFPRKDDLVLAYLDKVDQAWFGALRAAPGTPVTSPVISWSECSTRWPAPAVGTDTTAARSSTPPPSRPPAVPCTPVRSSTRPWSGPG